jgi:hypothetical protein
MSRRKGELSPAEVDRRWPHQVAMSGEAARSRFTEIREFCTPLSLAPRGHEVRHRNEWYRVYCFAEAEHAKLFLDHFGGEPFDPRERGRGSHWMVWRRGTAGRKG